MKKLFGAILAVFAASAFGATTVPVQLLNPTGSTTGQAIVSTGSGTAPAWGNVAATSLAAQGANTVLANVTASSASPTAFAMPSCSTTSSVLQYTSGSGWTCNTSINAATLGSATFAAPGPVGSTTASSGAFTTLSASGLITPSTTNGIKGTTAADSAQAGSWGEVITATNSAGSSLTSAVSINVTSISLTAGDWYVWGNVYYNPSAAGWTAALSGISTTSGTVPGSTSGNLSQFNVATGAGMAQFNQVATPQRVNVSTTTTVYLVGALTFSSGTATCYGTISAWRRR